QAVAARAAELTHVAGQVDDPVARRVDVEQRRVHGVRAYDHPDLRRNESFADSSRHFDESFLRMQPVALRRAQPASTSQPKPLSRRNVDMCAVTVDSESVRRTTPNTARIAADTSVIARECRLNQFMVRVSLPMARPTARNETPRPSEYATSRRVERAR